MTEADVLRRILSGWILVNLDTLEVKHWHRTKRRYYAKVPQQHKSGRWRFAFGKKRISVYRNRLIWMFVHRRLIPDGMVVDHIDENNENDRPDNLQLMDSVASHRQGNKSRVNRALEECLLFFSAKIPF